MEQLDRIESKLDQLLGQKAPVAGIVHELTAGDLVADTIDGTTVQADGSTWSRAIGPDGKESGEPQQLIYGYFPNRDKAPATFDRLAKIQTGGAAELQRILDENGAKARYKVHPEAIAQGGNFILLGMWLSSAIRAA